jgi:hypothetical protein
MDSTSPPEIASVGRPAENATLLQRIEELSRQVETLSAERDHRRSSPRDRRYNQRDRLSSPRNRRLNNNSPSRLDNATGSCWYHRRFGDRAQNCTQPSSYRREQGKLTRQTSAAAHVCSTANGRLFVTDKSSKLRFLIDTGSDLCMFPSKLIPQHRERVNYDLYAANPPTDGCRLASTWDCVENSHGTSWWPTSHNLSLEQTSCPTTAPWWTVAITAYWMVSRHCLSRPKPPGRWSPA